MLTGTRDFSEEYWAKANEEWINEGEKYEGLAIISCTGRSWGGTNTEFLFEKGKTYTFSFNAKGTTGNKLYGANIMIPPSIWEDRVFNFEIAIDEEWKRYNVFIRPTKDVHEKIGVETRKVYSNKIEICGLKLEEGENRNPIWTPNSEEMIFTKSELKTYLDEYMKK